MRLVDVPVPIHTYSVTVHKPVATHADLRDLVSGQFTYGSEIFAAQLRGALARSAVGAPNDGWDVLWFAYQSGPLIGIEATESVTLGCDGDDGGRDLYERLLAALSAEKLTEVVTRGRAAVAGSPVSCRWRSWTLGRTQGIQARLVASEQHVAVTPRLTPTMRCPTCRAEMRPVERVAGYPMPGYAEFMEALGEDADFLGCLVESGVSVAPWRCAQCRAGLVPGSLDPEEIAWMLLDGDPAPVPRCPRTFTDKQTTVWTPDFSLRGGGWSFRLFPGIAGHLDRSTRGWIVTRLGGGAAIFHDWESVRPLLPDPLSEPARPRVGMRDQATLRLAGSSSRGRLLPWLLPGEPAPVSS